MISKQAMICRACGQQTRANKKGTLALELALWVGAVAALVFIFPYGGLFGVVALGYSWWRAGSAARVKTCPHCHREGTVIPSDCPEGKRVAASYTTPPIVKR
ncbi:MAG TPA: hypothetical protein VIM71_05855 [Lacunisphaera sp.]